MGIVAVGLVTTYGLYAAIVLAFNLAAWQQGLRVQQVPWKGVSHTMRLEKMPGF